MRDVHARRKLDHLRICTDNDIQGGVSAGLEEYCLRHCALPELNLEQIDLSTDFLGKRLQAPLLISAMTGGTARAGQINRRLAQAAQSLGIAMCVGSQRAAIENSRQAATYQVRSVAPDVLLFANLGAVQLNYGYGVAQCRQAVQMIGADALVLHLNPLQEALQPGGNTNFSGLRDKIAAVCHELEVPVIVKEVGWGISESVARQLAAAGVAAVDVAGAGGTSWSEVERRRVTDSRQQRLAADFACWGIPTAEAIQQARRGAPGLRIIASGGIRTGPAVAVALALGADLVGLALPLLVAATVSAEAVQAELQALIDGLRISMFAAGLRNIDALKRARLDRTHAAAHPAVPRKAA